MIPTEKLGTIYTAITITSVFVSSTLTVGGIAVTAMDGLIVLAMYGFGCLILYRGKITVGTVGNAWRQTPYILFGIFASYLFFNNIYNGYPLVAVKELFQFAEYFIIATIISIYVRKGSTRHLFFRSLVRLIGSVLLFVVAWHVAHGYFVNYKRIVATKLLFGIPVIVAYASMKTRNLGMASYGPSSYFLGLYIFLLMASAERKAWVGSFAAALLIWGAHRLHLRKYVGHGVTFRRFARNVTLIGGIVVLGAVLMQFPRIQTQLSSLTEIGKAVQAVAAGGTEDIEFQSSSNQARAAIIAAGTGIIAQNPVFGIGTDQFQRRVERIFESNRLQQLGAHNEYLRYTIENGLIAVCLYILLWVSLLRKAWRLSIREGRGLRYEAFLALGLSVYGAVVNAFLSGGALNHVLLAVPMGIVCGLYSAAQSSESCMERDEL